MSIFTVESFHLFPFWENVKVGWLFLRFPKTNSKTPSWKQKKQRTNQVFGKISSEPTSQGKPGVFPRYSGVFPRSLGEAALPFGFSMWDFCYETRPDNWLGGLGCEVMKAINTNSKNTLAKASMWGWCEHLSPTMGKAEGKRCVYNISVQKWNNIL